MCLNTNFVVVIITSFCISSMCYTRIEYGKACGAGANLGVCKILAECPSAQAELKKPKYSPLPGCGFLPNGTQIICCKDFKSTSSTNHNHNIDEHSGIVWERETLSSITKKTPTLVDKNRGQKSETACAEYESKLTTSLDRHITAGDDANLGEFPHMAQIGYENPSLTGVTDWKCGGSLIHVRFVLTAAHCVETADKKYSPKVVRLGFVNINLPGNSNHVEREVLNNTVHPEYNRILQLNDIALIELVLEVKIDTYVYPACLYQKNDDPIHLIATGWGDTSTEATVTNYSQILQKVETQPVDLQSCSEIYRRDFTKMITPRQMCRLTPNSTADTCQGDSGGPLQKLRNEEKYMYDIVGVTAYGSGCGTGVTPGIYTRVYSYIDWIEGIVWP